MVATAQKTTFPATGGGATLSPDHYADVPYEEKLRLWDEVKADPRFPDYMYGCYECGICVAACPSALLLVSHDERFLDRLTKARWGIGRVEGLGGDTPHFACHTGCRE